MECTIDTDGNGIIKITVDESSIQRRIQNPNTNIMANLQSIIIYRYNRCKQDTIQIAWTPSQSMMVWIGNHQNKQ